MMKLFFLFLKWYLTPSDRLRHFSTQMGTKVNYGYHSVSSPARKKTVVSVFKDKHIFSLAPKITFNWEFHKFEIV